MKDIFGHIFATIGGIAVGLVIFLAAMNYAGKFNFKCYEVGRSLLCGALIKP